MIPRGGGLKNTLSMVGDSITWWQQGEYFRCLLVDNGLKYRFAGSRTDVFGYAHEGEGGNNTEQVLARMNGISPSGAYFLLVGTNDRASPLHTVSNILTIAQLLKEKAATGNGVKVFISTLLPRTDQFKERNVKVNVFLRESIRTCGASCAQIKLVDLESGFLSNKAWETLLSSDGLHPNKDGYRFLSELLARELSF